VAWVYCMAHFLDGLAQNTQHKSFEERVASSQRFLPLGALDWPEEELGFELLEQEHDNVRAALEWSGEQGESRQHREIAWRFIAALQWFWVNNGYVREGQQFVERVLPKGEGISPSIRAKALHGAGWLALWQGEYERAERLCRESLNLYQELHD